MSKTSRLLQLTRFVPSTARSTSSSSQHMIEPIDDGCFEQAISADNITQTVERLRNFNLSSLLANANIHDRKQQVAHEQSSTNSQSSRLASRHKNKSSGAIASVLVPFCRNSAGEPSVLFTLRSTWLNRHGGEISFPGGKQDPEDDGDFTKTACRETTEELNVSKDDINIFGQLSALPSRDGNEIIPVLGMINLNLTSSPSIMSSSVGRRSHQQRQLLRLDYSQDFRANHEEVEKVYIVPLRLLCDSRHWYSTRWKNYSLPTPVFWVRHLESAQVEQIPRIWGVTSAILYIALGGLMPDRFDNSSIFS